MALSFRRFVGRVAVGALAVAVPVVLTPPPASAAPTELFFSEYIEGSSNNKAVEIYNGTGAAVDLAAGGYIVQMYFNGSASAGLTLPTTGTLTGTVANGDVFVLAHSSAAAAILAHGELLIGWLEKSGYRDGCPIATVLLEIAPAEPAVTAAGRAAFADWAALFAEALIGLAGCADCRARMGAESRRRIEERFTVERMARDYRALLS